MALRPKNHFYALIAYEDAYVQPLILAALQKLFTPESYTLLTPPTSKPQPNPHAESRKSNEDEDEGVISLPSLLPANHPDASVLQITPYEAIDWEYVAEHPRSCLVNSYMLRKALIRKHYLASTIEHWVAKRPQSALSGHVKRAEAFEVDYAEFLDDALVEAFDLRASLERNAQINEGDGNKGDVEWWILKPSMSDRGQGIRLFSTMEELQGIFDGWEGSDDEDEDEDEQEQEDGNGGKGDRDYITASHLRHFVAQPYIHPPLLLPNTANRKFHIRTYVACVGALDVYVYRPMLALFAAKPYAAPGTQPATASGNEPIDLEAHLTNTCLQRSVKEGTVRRFWDLDMPYPPAAGEGDRKPHIFAQIRNITADLFEAAARAMPMHFRPLPNAFEAYGLDFLVDAAGTAWLLEVNAFPDFRQTGEDKELRGLVQGFWESVLRVAGGATLG
ncbi:TTL-domain-containing protein [Camillea tinctor]|nr:TTL-domain-containing protein [Camillea tinctor]